MIFLTFFYKLKILNVYHIMY